MKKLHLFVVVIVSAILTGCATTSTVPITGRKQSIIISDEQVLSLSETEYRNFLSAAKPSTNKANIAMVNRVAQNLANAVNNYLRNNGLSNELKSFQWEFHLVQEQEMNAFCMPGGKIVVFEGILPVTQNENSLAIVLAHEIAHAVAKHGAENISNSYRQQYGVQLAGKMLQGVSMSQTTEQIVSLVAAMGLMSWTAGFSRNQESEADHLGLIFAAMAGYNPQSAIPFWERFSKAAPGSNSLFADHPSSPKRVKAIKGWMKEALTYYKPKTNQRSAINKLAKAGFKSKAVKNKKKR